MNEPKEPGPEPHVNDEIAEMQMGEEIPDPWDDADQADWPQNEEEDV